MNNLSTNGHKTLKSKNVAMRIYYSYFILQAYAHGTAYHEKLPRSSRIVELAVSNIGAILNDVFGFYVAKQMQLKRNYLNVGL